MIEVNYVASAMHIKYIENKRTCNYYVPQCLNWVIFTLHYLTDRRIIPTLTLT
jgi:hypothetical protein